MRKILFEIKSCIVIWEYKISLSMFPNIIPFTGIILSKCLCCKKERLFKGEGHLICGNCIDICMLSSCKSCNKKIYTNTSFRVSELNISYCYVCVPELDKEIIDELSHEVVCEFLPEERRFRVNDGRSMFSQN